MSTGSQPPTAFNGSKLALLRLTIKIYLMLPDENIMSLFTGFYVSYSCQMLPDTTTLTHNYQISFVREVLSMRI